MNLDSSRKVLAAGFRIIRSDDTPAPRIKYLKYRASLDAVWVTLEDGPRPPVQGTSEGQNDRGGLKKDLLQGS